MSTALTHHGGGNAVAATAGGFHTPALASRDGAFDLGTFQMMAQVAQFMADSSLMPESLTHIGAKDSRKALAPQQVVANAFLVCDIARRWEMSPFAVAQSIALVHGKVCFEGKLVHAVIEARTGVRLNYEFNNAQGNALGVVVSGQFTGEAKPRTIEGTVAQWHKGDKSPWASPADWKRQLRYRGAREWARAHCPSVLLGVYAADEIDDASEVHELTPDIPEAEAPALGAPKAAAGTQTVARADQTMEPGRPVSDEQYLMSLEADMAVAKTPADLDEVVEANRTEVEERGLEQRAQDYYRTHRERIEQANAAQAKASASKQAAKPAAAKPAPAANQAEPVTLTAAQKDEAYPRIMKAMRNCQTIEQLAEVWRLQWPTIQALPANWVKSIEGEKEKLKAKLAPPPPPADDAGDPPDVPE